MTKRNLLGFIGLGVMGEPMCRHLVNKTGRKLIAFDLDSMAFERLAQSSSGEGLVQAKTVAEIAQCAQIIFLSLPSGEIVDRLVREEIAPHLQPGQMIVDLSTSAVDTTRSLAELVMHTGAAYVDAPVARTRAAAERGDLSVMVGALPEPFEQIEPFLARFASEITHCGGIGCGQIAKILNNMVLFETVLALSEAMAIAERAGMDRGLLLETLSKGSADSFALRNHGMKSILPRDFPERAFSINYARKDLGYALKLAEQVGVDALGARHVEELYRQAIDAGWGERYHPVISSLFDKKG